jgi:hypothetical protein
LKVDFLKKTNEQLKSNLESLLSTPKKWILSVGTDTNQHARSRCSSRWEGGIDLQVAKLQALPACYIRGKFGMDR